ncbi:MULTISPECIES: hypothetical protein [Bacillaceae]|nr:hypothetical protein [Bacillus weihaiensis]
MEFTLTLTDLGYFALNVAIITLITVSTLEKWYEKLETKCNEQ